MNWKELEEKHQQEWKDFEKLKNQAWGRMHEIHTEIKHAFGDDDSQIPQSAKDKMERDKQKWAKNWGKDGHKRAEILIRQHRESTRLMARDSRDRLVEDRKDRKPRGKDTERER